MQRPQPGVVCCMLLLVCSMLLGPVQATAQSEDTYDEISLILNVQRVGSVEIPAIIYKHEAFLPVKEIFDFLKIRNNLSQELDRLSGHIIGPESAFEIDKQKNQITYSGKIYPVKPGDLIQTETSLFLRSNYFGEVFGLICSFSFRSLSVSLTTKIDLPIIREMQQELVRKNISRLRGEKKADSIVDRKFTWIKMGVIDWAIQSNQQNFEATKTLFNLNLGAVLLGGEAQVFLNHATDQPFNKQNQFYRWRYVNNNNKLIRQVAVGKMFVQSTSTLFTPLNALQLSNTPTSYRRSYGTYTLSNRTEPGWMVELYINNVLVNFMKADASGFYSFEIPMTYGSSVVKLRFFGPWGEERTTEQYINIPFNFIPQNQFEYQVTGGVTADSSRARFARAKIGYGVSRHFTVGGGVEYLSSVNNGKPMPYLNASAKLGSRILLSGERMHGVRSEAALSYRSPSRTQIDFNYTKYDPGQTAVVNNYLEEKKLVLSKPFKSKKYAGFARFTYQDVQLVKSKITSTELLLSVMKGRTSTNFTTYAIVSQKKPLVYSNISTSLSLPGKIRLTQQVQYEYRSRNFSMLRTELEKNVFKQGYLNLAYQANLVQKTRQLNIGLRYNFSFAQSLFNTIIGQKQTTTTQNIRGSILYDGQSKYIGTSNQVAVGRAGFIIAPFLDLNCNGERDENEPKVAGLHLRVNGGRVSYNEKDSSIRVTGLEAYNNYFIELDKNSFDNIAWQIRNKTISVEAEPNNFKLIQVPVAVVGEVSGTVLLKNGIDNKGIGRILINIFNAYTGKLITRILTEADGYYSFVGLAPGKYTAAVDTDQLKKLNMTVTMNHKPFQIKMSAEGDIVEGMDFEISKSGESN